MLPIVGAADSGCCRWWVLPDNRQPAPWDAGSTLRLPGAPMQAEVLGEIEDRLVGYLQKGTGALRCWWLALASCLPACLPACPADWLVCIVSAACFVHGSCSCADTEAEVLSSVAAVLPDPLKEALPEPIKEVLKPRAAEGSSSGSGSSSSGAVSKPLATWTITRYGTWPGWQLVRGFVLFGG